MTLINGNCLQVLQEYEDNTFDLIVTDPPYGIAFMGKDWDKALPDPQVWKECFRTLKEGKMAFIMCSPRQDVLSRMIISLEDAGFRTNYTSIYWTYASGFPKAANISKLLKKNGKTDEKMEGAYVGFQPKPAVEVILVVSKGKSLTWLDDCRIPYSNDKDYDGSKYGAKTGLYSIRKMQIDQGDRHNLEVLKRSGEQIIESADNPNQKGRFPANLLVSDDVLNDGRNYKVGDIEQQTGPEGKNCYGVYGDGRPTYTKKGDSGSYSRYFDLDKWYSQFIITPKASKSERNKGLQNIPDKFVPVFDEMKLVRVNKPNSIEIGNYIKSWRIKNNISSKELASHFLSKTGGITGCVWNWEQGVNIPTKEEWLKLKDVLGFDDKYDKQMTEFVELDKMDSAGHTKFPQVRKGFEHNHHPTVKPLKLMSYLITMGSREGDTILDPFVGSGTTYIAALQLNRKAIGIELNPEYYEIAQARIVPYLQQTKLI